MIITKEPTSESLLLLLKEGNEHAFVRIYDQYWDKLYFVAHQKLPNQDICEEIVQEVFLILWKKRTELKIENLSNYLAAMVRYAVYRHIAKDKESRLRETIFHASQEKVLTIDKEIENKLLLEKILELSNQLPERCRLIFQYNKLEDQSISEIAQQFNISLKTAEAHLTKALKVIRVSMRSFLTFFL